MAPDYVLCHSSKVKEFTEGVKQKLKEFYGEKPTGSDQMGKMVSDIHCNRMQRILDTAGGEVICGGGKVNMDAKYCEPTVILNPNVNAEIMTDEIFGPIMPIIPFDTLKEVLDFINDRDKPLAVYYFGDHKGDRCKRVMNETSSGAFCANE